MSGKSPLFSVIVPVYNCEKYLDKLLTGILAQDCKDFELLLIDDGSTDNSVEICNQFKSKAENITVITKENTGVSDTRNMGMEMAKGKYFIFLDADDYIEPNYFSDMEKIIKEHKSKIDLICTGIITEVESNGKTFTNNLNYKTVYLKDKDEIRESLIALWDKHVLYNPVNKVYSRKIIEKNNIRFPNLYFGEDLDFNMQYVNCCNTIYNSEKCYYHYVRERKGSATERYDENLFKIRQNEFFKFNMYFEKNELSRPQYIEFSSRRFLERVVGCAENICSSDIDKADKKKAIKEIMDDEVVKDAFNYAELRSRKMKLLAYPIKKGYVNMCYSSLNTIGKIKKKRPDLFYKYKSKR